MRKRVLLLASCTVLLIPALARAEPLQAEPDLEPSRAAPPTLSKLPASPAMLSAIAGVSHRPSTSSRVNYEPGFSGSGSAALWFVDWLRLRLLGGMEFHQAALAANSLQQGEPAQEVSLKGLRLGAQLEPVLPLTGQLDLWLGIGAAWARFEAQPLDFDTAGGGAVTLPERAGVVIEFPVTIGGSVRPFGEHFGISLSATFGLASDQSGALFDARRGRRQAVRQDDGSLVTLAGFPKFGHALSTQLSLDYFL